MKTLGKYKAIILLVIGILGILAVNWDKLDGFYKEEVIEYNDQLITTDSKTSSDYVMVDIKGEVKYPGLYEVESDKRIGEVIEIAGGLTVNADVSDINLAQKITDEMKIIIPANDSYLSDLADEIVKIIVEIKGEVNNPGVYELYQNQRVMDLIVLAGGVTDMADLETVNLVKILEDQTVLTIPAKKELINEKSDDIVVEIKGEVENPGIYSISSGKRLYDLIIMAGGLTDKADQNQLELAHLLLNGETIFVPTVANQIESKMIFVQIHGEILHPGTYSIEEGSSILDLINLAGGVTTNCDLSKINWDIILCLGAVVYIPSFEDQMEDLTDSGLVNINTADLETLMTLNGIGQILGQRIIDYRAEYGDFLSIEDIMNVSGIKESIYEQIQNDITV